jgi:hypothetical protein
LRHNLPSTVVLLLGPAVIVIAGCGGHVSASDSDVDSRITIQAAASHIDTNRTTRYSATLADGEPANVEWSVSGGDPRAGAGSISRDGVYTPPSYLTRDAVTIEVSAVLAGRSNLSAPQSEIKTLTVTPGFLQPLTPGNLSLGPNGTVTISGSMTEVGGSGAIRFGLASDPAGTPSNAGTLSSPHCLRGSVEGSNPAYTVCSVTYTAPASIAASSSVYILGSVASNPTLSWTRILLNSAGISSNPAAHQARLAVPVQLGSSSGSNVDYDANLGQLTDCCGGTLGALAPGRKRESVCVKQQPRLRPQRSVASRRNHRSAGAHRQRLHPVWCWPRHHACGNLDRLSGPQFARRRMWTPRSPALLPAWLTQREASSNLAQNSPTAPSPPHRQAYHRQRGKGESAALGMMVAKSGRTTGLTCAAVSAIDVDVVVDYFTDCAETNHSITKTFTNQIAISGTNFSDAGDSGALVVDTANAEPVGLFFAGATDSNGVEHAIASPAADVLASLDTQVPETGSPASYTFVGGADHPVSCLSYDGTAGSPDEKSAEKAGSPALTAMERERAEAALVQAQLLVNPSNGIVRAGIVASRDRPGAGAVAFYLEATANPPAAAAIPASVGGVPTLVLPATSPVEPATLPITFQPRAVSLNQALAAKQKIAAVLLKSNPAIFGVGVGQSLDNPSDAAVMLFVDRKKSPGALPESLDGVRVRIVLMDRFHVTRAHGTSARTASGCSALRSIITTDGQEFDPAARLLEDRLQLPE